MTGEYSTGHDIVFIVGCPRSGTTWLQKLVACCPAVRTGQESDVFDLFVGPQLRNWRVYADGRIAGRPGVGLSGYHYEDGFLDILKRYLDELLQPMTGELPPGGVFVEKTPSHALYLPEIMELLPRSRVIHLVRDARDTAASLLAASKGWGRHWAPSSARDAARMWRTHVEAVMQARDIIPKGQFMEVRYESLLDDPMRVLAALEDGLLDLGWSREEMRDAVRAHPPGGGKGDKQAPPVFGEASRNRDAEASEPEGFIRRAASGGWHQDLSPLEKFQVWREARHTMDKAGYPWPLPL